MSFRNAAPGLLMTSQAADAAPDTAFHTSPRTPPELSPLGPPGQSTPSAACVWAAVYTRPGVRKSTSSGPSSPTSAHPLRASPPFA